MKTEVFLGTELKLNVNIEPLGAVTMDDFDFEVEAYCNPSKSLVILKKDSIRVDENNYIVRVDTNKVGLGYLKCKVTANIPDTDFSDGRRTEVDSVCTGIVIVKA